MPTMQKPGAEHTYEYIEYPSVRYHPTEDPRTITCKAQEEKGWYDSPTKANAVAKKLLLKAAEKAAEEKEAMRLQRAEEKEALAKMSEKIKAEKAAAPPPEDQAAVPPPSKKKRPARRKKRAKAKPRS